VIVTVVNCRVWTSMSFVANAANDQCQDD